jgi:hypothetical protein
MFRPLPERGEPTLRFTFDGRPMGGRAGDTVAAALLGAGAAEATPRPLRTTHIGTASLFIGTDGARFAAWVGDRAGETVVYDAATATTTRTALPEGCSPQAIGAGTLLAACTQWPYILPGARLLDLRTGLWREVVPPANDAVNGSLAFVAVGRRWIEATHIAADAAFSVFYSRSDGSPYAGSTPFGRRLQPDLDGVALRRRLCSPLTPSNSAFPLQFEGRIALDPTTPLTLRHCGTSHRQVLCRHWCFTPLLRHRRVLWADDLGRLHVRELRTRRFRTYALPNHSIDGVYPLGARLLFTTDRIAGIRREAIRLGERGYLG